jgi:hypothetical protein
MRSQCVREFAGFAVMALVGPLLAACSVANPQIGQLDTFKQQAAAEQWGPIAASQASCDGDSPSCPQLHQLKADACMTLAMRAQSAAQAPQYDCAVAQYDAAIHAQAARPDAAVDLVGLRTGEPEALQRRRDRSRSRQEATPFNDRPLCVARLMVNAVPGQAAGFYYLASTLLSQGLAEPVPQGCRSLDRATAAHDKAAIRSGAVPEAIAQRRRDIANARAGRCRA